MLVFGKLLDDPMVKQSHVLLTLKGLQKEFLLLLVAIEFDLTLGRRRYSRASIARVRCSMGEANNAICGRTIRITVFFAFFRWGHCFCVVGKGNGGGGRRARAVLTAVRFPRITITTARNRF